jgi:hypothetical protein
VKVFALGDPHLSAARDKPMDVFGERWRDHPAKIARAWDAEVGADDVVLVVGDISWARSPREAVPDLEFLGERPGRLKVLLRGNHDSWWRSRSAVERILPPGMAVVQNDALRLDEDGLVLCGARGWNAPGTPWEDPDNDPPIYERELHRLDLSLQEAARLRQPGDTLIGLLHYPPLAPDADDSEVLERLNRAGVAVAAYGHLHGDEDHAWAPRGRYGDIELRFVAADFTDFRPQPIWEQGRGVVPEPAR